MIFSNYLEIVTPEEAEPYLADPTAEGSRDRGADRAGVINGLL